MKLVPGLAQQRLGAGAGTEGLGGILLRQQLHIGLQKGFCLPQPVHPGAMAALHDDADRSGRKSQDLDDVGHGTDLIEVCFLRLGNADLLLGHQKDILVILHGPLQGGNGDAALHIEGQVHMGENREAPQGQHGNIHCNRFHWLRSFL